MNNQPNRATERNPYEDTYIYLQFYRACFIMSSITTTKGYKYVLGYPLAGLTLRISNL